MSSDSVVEEQDGITTIRLTRQLTLDEALRLQVELASVGVSVRRLWDVRKYFNFSADEIRRIADHGKELWPGAGRVAFVVEDDLNFGLARMHEVFREKENYQTRVFRDENSARKWLLDWVE